MTTSHSSEFESNQESDPSRSVARSDWLANLAFTESQGAAARRPVPFVWQHGKRLLLLTEDDKRWVFAELYFDSAACAYVERRRIEYDWEREAVGAVLSRAFAAGLESVECAARAMNRWLLIHYGHSVAEAPTVRSLTSR